MSDDRIPIKEIDSAITTPQMVARELFSLEKLVFSEIEGIKNSIKLAHADMVRVPTDVEQKVGTLQALHDERFNTVNVRFDGIIERFKERDVRDKQKEESQTKALDAALKSQRDTAEKSEQQLRKGMDDLQNLFQTEMRGLQTSLTDLKERFGRLEFRLEGAAQNKTETRASGQYNIAIVGIGITILMALMALGGFLLKGN
jgi:hypothetical protein